MSNETTLANGFERIFKQWRDDAQAAARLTPSFVDSAAEPHCRYLWNPLTGTFEKHDTPAADRAYCVDDFDDFCETVNRLAPGEDNKAKPAIFVDEQGALCVLNEAERHETVRLRLVQTTTWEKLVELSRGVIQWQPHPAFVAMIRTDLADAIDDAFSSKITSLKWSTSDAGESIVKTGNDEWSRNVAAAARLGGDDVPPLIAAHTNVFEQFDDASINGEVICAVLVDTSKRLLAIRPRRKSIEFLRMATLRLIRDRIAAECGQALVVCGRSHDAGSSDD